MLQKSRYSKLYIKPNLIVEKQGHCRNHFQRENTCITTIKCPQQLTHFYGSVGKTPVPQSCAQTGLVLVSWGGHAFISLCKWQAIWAQWLRDATVAHWEGTLAHSQLYFSQVNQISLTEHEILAKCTAS